MWTRLRNRLGGLRRRRTIQQEIDEELVFHREMLARRARADGAQSSTADANARRLMGNLARAREGALDAWAFRRIEAFVHDVRLSIRSLVRDAGFSGVVLITLAMGIGANLAIFQFVDSALLASLPVRHAQELVLVDRAAFSYPLVHELAQGAGDVFESVAARTAYDLNVTLSGLSDYVPAEFVSGAYFSTLGVQPAIGRLLDETDDGAPGAHPVCVISDAFWRRRFGRNPSVVGQYVDIDAHRFQIVGVTESGFEGGAVQRRFDIQVPMSMAQTLLGVVRDSPKYRWVRLVARLRPGVSATQAQAAIRVRVTPANHPQELRVPITLSSGRRGFARGADEALATSVLMAQALGLCVLLVSCASLAGLLLTRGSARQTEIAVRQALGATRGRLLRQMMTEALVLTATAAISGVGLAALMTRVLATVLFAPGTNMYVQAWPSIRGVAAASALAVSSALAFSLAPALLFTQDLRKPDSKTSHRVTTRTTWLGRSVIVAQMALCLVLVFGAGLLARSLSNLRAIPTGLATDDVAVITASPERTGYTRADARSFYAEWLRRAEALPDVRSAGLASIAAMSGEMDVADVSVPGATAITGPRPNNNFNVVTPDYFRTVGLDLIAGRSFTDTDAQGAPAVAVVNQQFIDAYWPGEAAVGRRIVAGGNDVRIVGVVQTAKYQDLREEPQIVIYRPFAQSYWNQLKLHARVTGDVQSALAALARVARDIDPRIPVYGGGSLSGYVDASVANERALSLVGTLFALLGLLVAATGLFGVVAYSVARRSKEIGVRMALGARPRQIAALFMRHTLGLVVLGLAVGVPAALLAGQVMRRALYHVSPFNLPAALLAGGLLAGVALAATGVPAMRAGRIDPIVAIRTE